MELNDLSHNERVVMLALMEFLVEADSAGSSDEAVHVAELASAYGKENYLALLEEARGDRRTEEEFHELVASVESQETRDFIYGKVMECAMDDGIHHRESEFLEWLVNEWDIEVTLLDEDIPS